MDRSPRSVPSNPAPVNQTGSRTSNNSEGPALSGETDLELVQAVKNGEPGAFRKIFDRYHRRAYAVAIGIVKNPQDALDVVQDAFVKVHKHLGSFEGNSSFYTWLYRIVMNVAIDHNRKRVRGQSVELDERIDHSDARANDGGSITPKLTDGNPSEVLSRKELAAKLEAALATLPEHHRAVIVLRELEGMSYEEMAEVLNVPKGTIMSRLFHARHKMQAALKGAAEEAGYEASPSEEEP